MVYNLQKQLFMCLSPKLLASLILFTCSSIKPVLYSFGVFFRENLLWSVRGPFGQNPALNASVVRVARRDPFRTAITYRSTRENQRMQQPEVLALSVAPPSVPAVKSE